MPKSTLDLKALSSFNLVQIFKQGPHVPNPQSQPFSPSYRSKLPTSLAYLSPADQRLQTLETWCSFEYDHGCAAPFLWLFKSSEEHTRNLIRQGKLSTAQPHLHKMRFQGNKWLKRKDNASHNPSSVPPNSITVAQHQPQPGYGIKPLIPFKWWGKTCMLRISLCPRND